MITILLLVITSLIVYNLHNQIKNLVQIVHFLLQIKIEQLKSKVRILND